MVRHLKVLELSLSGLLNSRLKSSFIKKIFFLKFYDRNRVGKLNKMHRYYHL